MKLLIIDDDENVRTPITWHFEELDWDVTVVENKKEAMKHYNDHWDAVICDVKLVDGFGDDIVADMLTINKKPLYLLHTGFVGYTLPPKLKELGLTEKNILIKPVFDIGGIIKRIEDHYNNFSG